MAFKTGTTDVPTAGTRVQISATTEKIKAIAFKAPIGNAATVYFGDVTVKGTATIVGYPLDPGEAFEADFGQGSEFFNAFYVDAAVSGDDVCWAVRW